MNTHMNLLVDLFENNQEAISELAKCKSKEAVLQVLAQYNIVMTEDEFDALIAENEGEELSEDALDQVAGGGKVWNAVKSFFIDLAKGFLDAM